MLSIIAERGSAEQRERFLPALMHGETLAFFGLTEPNVGSDASGVETRAERDPARGGWRLRGRKLYISNGVHADLGVVFARTGSGADHAVCVYDRQLLHTRIAGGRADERLDIRRTATGCCSSRQDLGVLQLLHVRRQGWAAQDRLGRKLRGAELAPLHDALDRADGVVFVVDREVLFASHDRRDATQHAGTECVERAAPHALGLVPEELGDAGTHLTGGLVRERDGQNLTRPRLAVLQQQRNAAGENRGLPRPGARDDKKCGAAVRDGVCRAR